MDNKSFEIIERKGIGHPDVICDSLAENAAKILQRYCLKRYDQYCRFNIDQVHLYGGETCVEFGKGEMISPFTISLYGKVAVRSPEERSYLSELILRHSQQYLRKILRKDISRFCVWQINLVSYPSLKAPKVWEDSSVGVGFAPFTKAEKMILKIGKWLDEKFPCNKILLRHDGDDWYLIISAAFKAKLVPNLQNYLRQKKTLTRQIYALVKPMIAQGSIQCIINAAGPYLTLTGSAIENDKGMMGRGNQWYGFISCSRPHGTDICWGKNPWFHPGKVCTRIAFKVADKAYAASGCPGRLQSKSKVPMTVWVLSVKLEKQLIRQRSMLDLNRYHIRISVTPHCNFRCMYCNPKAMKECAALMSDEDLIEFVSVAREAGIKRVHWTGGEPTIKPNIIELVQKMRDLGIEKQIITTNGFLFYRIAENLKDAGLSRINISLDTLQPKKFKEIVGLNVFDKVMLSILEALRLFPLVKINWVLLKKNADEIIDIFKFGAQYPDKMTLKFIELVPNNPVFYDDDKLFAEQHLSREEFFQIVKAYGEPVSFSVEGDNPNCHYFKIKGTPFSFGLISMHSLGYPCSYCKKIRVSPYGFMGGCISGKPYDIKNTPRKEKKKILEEIIKIKEWEDEMQIPKRHFNAKFGFWRFGAVNKPKSYDI
ncbi:MAG: methionine adenosyltransferase [Patescibacteria group bacterium]